jgi:hypothetical protein
VHAQFEHLGLVCYCCFMIFKGSPESSDTLGWMGLRQLEAVLIETWKVLGNIGFNPGKDMVIICSVNDGAMLLYGEA